MIHKNGHIAFEHSTMTGSFRFLVRGTLLTVPLLLALSVTEAQAQVFVGGTPGYGYNPGVFGTTGVAGGYSSYGSRSFSTFGLGGFQRGFGSSYSSGYVAPGVGVYPVPAYGGYPGYGGGYPVYGGGYPVGGFPDFRPPVGHIPMPGPGPGPGPEPGNRTSSGFDRVRGGTHVPGFGVLNGSFR